MDTQEPTPKKAAIEPSRCLPEWQLYEPRVLITDKGPSEIGVRVPDGKYYPFQNGEQFCLIREEGGRKPYIRLADGSIVTFDAWKNSRREEIRKIFENIDPHFAQIYLLVLNDYPDMDQLGIEKGTKEQHPVLEYTGGFWRRPDTTNPNPSMVVDLESERPYEKLLVDRKLSARIAAQMLGIDFEVLQRNPETLGLFIFLHEMGHARDYFANYLNSAKNLSNENYDPVEENQKQRDGELATLPVPKTNPVQVRKMYDSGELVTYFDKYREYYQLVGINTPQDLLVKHEESYRNLPSEYYADQFAASILRKYWQVLGFDKKTGIPEP